MRRKQKYIATSHHFMLLVSILMDPAMGSIEEENVFSSFFVRLGAFIVELFMKAWVSPADQSLQQQIARVTHFFLHLKIYF